MSIWLKLPVELVPPEMGEAEEVELVRESE
jgi:hypothetical protein